MFPLVPWLYRTRQPYYHHSQHACHLEPAPEIITVTLVMKQLNVARSHNKISTEQIRQEARSKHISFIYSLHYQVMFPDQQLWDALMVLFLQKMLVSVSKQDNCPILHIRVQWTTYCKSRDAHGPTMRLPEDTIGRTMRCTPADLIISVKKTSQQ